MTDERESTTAKICSFARAYHSVYAENKIFDDYLAYKLLGKEEYQSVESLLKYDMGLFDVGADSSDPIRSVLGEFVTPIVLPRISYAENRLQRFFEKHGECQYVICGAGIDTFAFRNKNPGIRIFEIDHPDTQRYKLKRILELGWQIPENVHYVPVDFGNGSIQSGLIKAGFRADKKTFFSILGVAYYLELPVFSETLKSLSELSGAGNEIVFDYPEELTTVTDYRVRRLAEITAYLGENMHTGFRFFALENILRSLGFVISEQVTPEMIQSEYLEGSGSRAYENVNIVAVTKV
jgi:methyltransferase (TIGR00027 family)